MHPRLWLSLRAPGLPAMTGASEPERLLRLLPLAQRRTTEELTDDLDLSAGDVGSKRSAFWTMLSLSSVIASAGVLADSTATVIGAMIIAPLATPIMGIALAVAKGARGAGFGAAWFVLRGAILVIGVGAVFSLALPGSFDLLGDSQISSRTSPGFLDLVAAIATGFAGAIALARRDVATVLPGVAIAISLVPPLAVVGVCLGQGAVGLALGALLLFVSNLLALILAGTLVFAAVGHTARPPDRSPRRAYLAIALLLILVGVPLVANTVGTYLLSVFTERVQTVAEDWLAQTPGASVAGVEFVSNEIHVEVQTPGELPPVDDLLTSLEGRVPAGLPVVVVTSLGQRIDVGTVGTD